MFFFSLLSKDWIKRGAIISARPGMGVVIRVHGEIAIIVWINKGPSPRHRADLYLTWYGAPHLKLQYGDVIRCVPFKMYVKHLHFLNVNVPFSVLRRIEAEVYKEILLRNDEERCHQISGGPNIPCNRIYSR